MKRTAPADGMPRRDPPGLARNLAACDRVHAAGREVTALAVRAELLSRERVKASQRDVTVAVVRWRAAYLARCSGRIEAAAAALLVLETDAERDAVALAVKQRTAGGVQLKFTVKRRAKRRTAWVAT